MLYMHAYVHVYASHDPCQTSRSQLDLTGPDRTWPGLAWPGLASPGLAGPEPEPDLYLNLYLS